MGDLSERTKAEMQAGAQRLADLANAPLPPGYMEALLRTHERQALIRRWEAAGKVTLENSRRYRAGNVMYERENPPETWHTMYHVLPGRGGPTFTDLEAERAGGSPSEVLVANIALALQAEGEL